jgi:hypothetical protein
MAIFPACAGRGQASGVHPSFRTRKETKMKFNNVETTPPVERAVPEVVVTALFVGERW